MVLCLAAASLIASLPVRWVRQLHTPARPGSQIPPEGLGVVACRFKIERPRAVFRAVPEKPSASAAHANGLLHPHICFYSEVHFSSWLRPQVVEQQPRSRIAGRQAHDHDCMGAPARGRLSGQHPPTPAPTPPPTCPARAEPQPGGNVPASGGGQGACETNPSIPGCKEVRPWSRGTFAHPATVQRRAPASWPAVQCSGKGNPGQPAG